MADLNVTLRLKAHLEVNLARGAVHMVTGPAANVADIAQTHALLPGNEKGTRDFRYRPRQINEKPAKTFIRRTPLIAQRVPQKV